MQIVLLVVGLLSLYPLRQLGTGLLLILLTLVNAVLGLQQEGEAGSAVAALQRRLIVTARVRRDDQEAEVPAEQLVPGDVLSMRRVTSFRLMAGCSGWPRWRSPSPS